MSIFRMIKSTEELNRAEATRPRRKTWLENLFDMISRPGYHRPVAEPARTPRHPAPPPPPPVAPARDHIVAALRWPGTTDRVEPIADAILDKHTDELAAVIRRFATVAGHVSVPPEAVREILEWAALEIEKTKTEVER